MRNRDEIHAAFGPDEIQFVTPAAPGFYVLSAVTDSTDTDYLEAGRDPVIAWALSESGCSYPVTLDYGLEQKGDPAILCPDGQVRSFGIGWENLADWLDDQKKARARHGKLR